MSLLMIRMECSCGRYRFEEVPASQARRFEQLAAAAEPAAMVWSTSFTASSILSDGRRGNRCSTMVLK